MRVNKRPFIRQLIDPESIGSVLLIGLLDEYGSEMFDWEPRTLDLEVKHDWGVSIPQVNKDKVWALVTELTTKLFYSSLDAFTHICNSLNGSGADFENFDFATVQEMCWALAEVQLLDPPEEGDQFNPEILSYMSERLRVEAFERVPKILKPYVTLPDRDENIANILQEDGVEAKTFWDRQMREVLSIDQYVREQLHKLFVDLAGLPLENGDSAEMKATLERAGKVLAGQSQQTAREEESVRPAPRL
jgi:hypothetical protein